MRTTAPSWSNWLAGVCAGRRLQDVDSTWSAWCAPAGQTVVTSALATHFPVGSQMEIELGRPSTKLIRELIDRLIPEVSPHSIVTRSGGWWAIHFLRRYCCVRPSRNRKSFRRHSVPNTCGTTYFISPSRVPQAACFPAQKALRALAVYAACAPVRPADAVIRASAAVLSGLTPADVEVLEQRLPELLQSVPGRTGALILEETGLDEQASRRHSDRPSYGSFSTTIPTP